MGRYIENFFEKFFEHRDYTIRQFLQGDLSKREYIEESYYFIKSVDVNPYKKIDNPEKAIYNYQYYNMNAKFLKLKVRELNKYGKHPEKIKEYMDKVNWCYRNKDYATLKLLELLEYENLEGYYIKVQSKELRNKLFEIVFYDYKNLVFHSVNPFIIEKLRENGVFTQGSRKSLIDSYINARY